MQGKVFHEVVTQQLQPLPVTTVPVMYHLTRASVVLAVVAQSAVFARRVGSLGHIVLEGNRLFVSALPLHRTDHKLLTMWLIRRITCLTINNIF